MFGWAFLSSCAGAPAAPGDPQLKNRLAELREQNRLDRQRMRDLEHRLVLLQDQMTTEAPSAPSAPTEPPLPIEVVEPEIEPASPVDEPAYEVVGLDDRGNQIVYVGDAAKDESVRPSIVLYQAQEPRAMRRERRIRPPLDAPLEPLPTAPEERIVASAGAPPTVAQQLAQARSSGRPTRRASRASDDGPRADYQRYYDALRAGNHRYAIAGFDNFLARYPDHALADNAQYWLAEAHYDRKELPRALAAFREVVERFPEGNKVPDALLKIGYCYLALNQESNARVVLKQLVQIYPDSGPAGLAAQRLATLESKEVP